MDSFNINRNYEMNGYNGFYNDASQLLHVRQLHQEYSDDTSM